MKQYSEELKRIPFNPNELKELIYGSKENWEEITKIYKVISQDPLTKFCESETEMNRNEKIIRNWQRIPRTRELVKEHNLRRPDYITFGPYGIASNNFYPMSLSHGMFETVIKILGSDKQVEEYLEPTLSEEIIGWYAQTEIGHGSDVQRLMTTAELDKKTQEFIINCPSVQAYKFWPGDLGLVATHAVIFARLIIDGNDFGVSAFIVQIRDLKTHRPLKGIEIGEIGPKLGYNLKDNGYLAFFNHRVSKNAIMSRYIDITEDGGLVLQGNPKVAYATMMLIRVFLLKFGYEASFYSIFISMKYLLFRTQFRTLPNSDEERKLFNYQTSQRKLLPIMATAFANLFAYKKCFTIYDQMLDQIKNNKFGLMKELHSLCCGFKAYFMEECLANLKITRELCGAHGFSDYSGFEYLFEVWTPKVTIEGDSYVMFQQTSREILKQYGKISKGNKAKRDFKYLNDIQNIIGQKLDFSDLNNMETLLTILKASSLYQLVKTSKLLGSHEDIPYIVKWNKMYLLDVVECARLHSIYSAATIFYEEIQECNISNELKDSLVILCKIYAWDSIMKRSEESFIMRFINSDILFKISDLLDDLIVQIRPSIVGLVEGSRADDTHNFSFLSTENEKVYERMYEQSARLRVNSYEKLRSYDKSIKPLRNKLIAKI